MNAMHTLVFSHFAASKPGILQSPSRFFLNKMKLELDEGMVNLEKLR
jgi:hypothetical protein